MDSAVRERPLLTVAETAERLHLGERTVYRLVDRGELPAVRIRSLIRIDEGELARWLVERRTTT